MTALPLTHHSSPPPELGGASCFRRRLRGLESEYCVLWHESSNRPPVLGPPVGRLRQLSNARRTRRLIDEIAERIEAYPADRDAAARWRQDVRESIREFGESCLNWPASYRNLLTSESYWQSTVDFAREARAFAPGIDTEDLFQALRNVWIMNSNQMLLDLEVEMTPALFAYSMLYPWTDNYLDAPEVSGASKRRFNRRLALRLRGKSIVGANRHEKEVFELVARIERQFPRHLYPEAHFSIQAIHRAQSDSLRQQASRLPAEELLHLSVRKGGSSVLPDAYLVAGKLTAEEIRFMFGYGVFLQLLDDLQDLEADEAAGHQTVFTDAGRGARLDEPAAKLHAFIHTCLDRSRRFHEPQYEARLDLIRRNCVALLVTAVAENPRRFSQTFRQALERRWPLRFPALRSLRRYAQKRFSRLEPVLENRFGSTSILDLLCRVEAEV